jgi:tryptophan halogenase|tara:strand:+ start:87 stop:1172 length:1086 start_codon:yes stop_codon:yes gene_type:complete
VKRIAIVGAGNAGSITALYIHNEILEDKEILLYHSPNDHPIEKVGQGTVNPILELIHESLGCNWYDNPLEATIKTGILYEGWGKKQDKIFHPFSMHEVAAHFVPEKLSKAVLESGLVNVIEKTIDNPEEEIDADMIFDCRGRHNRDSANYDTLINPLNSVLLAHKEGKDPDLTYTRTVATPNGWTFIIPNLHSVSYGYLYNDTITSTQVAREDFMNRFRIYQDSLPLSFENYVAKNMFVGERTILQGNMYGFLEPMESTSINLCTHLCEQAFNKDRIEGNNIMRRIVKELETFILWHYQFGSKYNTPFWEYAKSLPFNPDNKFKSIVDGSSNEYGFWQEESFKNWKDGVYINPVKAYIGAL